MSRSLLLDSQLLSTEVHSQLLSQFDRMFSLFPLNFRLSRLLLTDFRPEVNAILSALLTSGALSQFRSTLGQRALGIRLADLTTSKQVLYVALGVIPTYLSSRKEALFKARSWNLDQLTRYLQNVLKAAQIVNFLVFLQQGLYPTLTNRLLGIRPIVRAGQRQIGEEIASRELLWHSFIELLMLVIPLLNVHKIRNYLATAFTSPAASSHGQPADQNSAAAPIGAENCAFCQSPPILPHLSVCPHVFCYFCLAANLKASPDSFPCPRCRVKQNSKQLRQLKL